MTAKPVLDVAYVSVCLSGLRGGAYLMYSFARGVSDLRLGDVSFFSIELDRLSKNKVSSLLAPSNRVKLFFVEMPPESTVLLFSKVRAAINDVATYNCVSMTQLYLRAAPSKLNLLPSKTLVDFLNFPKKDYDIVHMSLLESPFSSAVDFLKKKRCSSKTKFVCQIIYHPVPFSFVQKFSPIRIKAMVSAAKSFDALTCSTPYETNLFKALGVKNVHLIGEGIDLEFIESHSREIAKLSEELRAKLGLDNGKIFVVLFIGSRDRLKGYYNSIAAFNNLVSKGIDDVLFIAIGRRNLADTTVEAYTTSSIEAKLKKKGKFVCYDFVKEELKYALISLSDVLVVPSLVETVPLAVLEAWAFKKPVIVAKIPTVLSVTGNDSAVVTEFGQIGQIENGYLALMKDEFYAKELGENGYSHVVYTYNLKTIAGKLATLYQEIPG